MNWQNIWFFNSKQIHESFKFVYAHFLLWRFNGDWPSIIHHAFLWIFINFLGAFCFHTLLKIPMNVAHLISYGIHLQIHLQIFHFFLKWCQCFSSILRGIHFTLHIFSLQNSHLLHRKFPTLLSQLVCSFAYQNNKKQCFSLS